MIDALHSGYNAKQMREEGLSLKPKTRAIYLPLIDMTSAEHDTILTSMLQIKKLTEATGQPFALLTLDQQLYRYAVEIQWELPEVFSSFIFHLETWGYAYAHDFHWSLNLWRILQN